jgi:hypothetical protein
VRAHTAADLIGCAARIGEQSAAPIGVIGALVGDALGLIDVGVGVVRYRAGIDDRAEQAMAGRVAEFEALGPWSLETSRRFWEGFTPAALAGEPAGSWLRTVFCADSVTMP